MPIPTRPSTAASEIDHRPAAPARQVVLVTGASSGAGEAVARRLAADGHRVVLGARRTIVLAGIAQDIALAGGDAICRQLDVTQPESFQGFAELALREFGRIDVLVNAAGLGAPSQQAAAAASSSSGPGVNGVDVPLRGLLHGLAAVLPVMQAQRTGRIVNLAPASHAPGNTEAALREACAAALRALSASVARSDDTLRVSTIETERATPPDIAGAVAAALRA